MKKNIIMVLSVITAISCLMIINGRIPRADLQQHYQIQRDFLNLIVRVGLSKVPPIEIAKICSVSGQTATQARFNMVRSSLNSLLSKEILTDNDINRIENLIKDLALLKPARWPQPKDYLEILILRK